MPETLVGRILELGRFQPDKIAVAFKNERLTYKELSEKLVRIGTRLRELGVNRGDRVLFSATSKPEMAAAYLGIQYIGAVAVFLDKNAAADTSAYIYEDTEARIFLTDKPLKNQEKCNIYSLRLLFSEEGDGETAADYLAPEDNLLAEMIYTSGTTGRPKGVMLTYKAVRHIWENTIKGVGMRQDDCILLPLPLNHSFALRVLRAGLYLGATVVLQNGFTFAREIENNLDRFHCTAIAIVPASVETIAKQMQDKFSDVMGQFRYIEVSAGSLTVEQRKRLVRLLPNTSIINTWGSSESGGALFLDVNAVAGSEHVVSALGKPLDGVSVITLDENGQAFASDREHPGRMALKGDMQMAGYWNKPELTAEALKGGWLLTGDMIYMEEDYVYMLGRADDIINVGGEKVSPVEVENIAGQYENISECACIGVPDPDGMVGSVPVLFVVPRSGRYSEAELTRFLAEKLERFKLPEKYVELAELPRNKMQKIDRKALKLLWENKSNTKLINETIQNLLTRRSIRRFTENPVPRELLEMILKTGCYAPSGHNMQTWKFTVIQNPEKIKALKEAAVRAAEENRVYCYGFENPPVIVLVSNDERNPDGCQDASCAAENMMLAAWSYGIGSVWLNPLRTLRNKEPVKAVLDSFGIPENHVVWSMIALGYPVAEGTLLKKKNDVVAWID